MRGRAATSAIALLAAQAALGQAPAAPSTPARPAAPAPAPTQPPPATSSPRPGPAGIGAPAPPPSLGAAPAMAARKKALGEEAARAGEWRAALFAFQEAAYLEPQRADLRLLVGSAYEKLDHDAEAVIQYQIAAALQPPGEEARQAIARVRARAGRDRTPAPAARKTPAAVPYERGVALVYKGQYAEAVQSLDEALRLDPRLAQAYAARASARLGLRQVFEALVDYRAALEVGPGQATPLYGIAECYRALGRTAEAQEEYRRYLASTAPDVREDLQAEARKRLAPSRP